MATNQLLPFANGSGANVETYANWSALAQVATGFGSGLAVSKHFNYILAQGGAAGYAIGKVVVDWLGQDATIDATTLGSNFEAALEAKIGGPYLPLAGGTMTSSAKIAWNVALSPRLKADAQYVQLGYDVGGLITLRSANYAPNPNGFDIDAGYTSGGATCRLRGMESGSLLWNSKEVERVNDKGSNYIKFDSGLGICWGREQGTNLTVTFPFAYAKTPYVVANSKATVAKGTIAVDVYKTYFKLYNSETNYVSNWTAIGWWK